MVIAALAILILTGRFVSNGKRGITVFSGSAFKPPMEDLAEKFTEKTGIPVTVNYGGSGSLLSQLIISRSGDVYIPGSNDFMERARRKGIIDHGSITILAYLVPVIAVGKGNPKKITALEDLLRQDVRAAIGDPGSVCVGLYAVEVFDLAGLSKKIRRHLKTYATSCEHTANLLVMNSVDAVVGWDVFDDWNPGHIETLPIDRRYVKRAAYIGAARTSFSRNPEHAGKFLSFLESPEAKNIIKQRGYLVTMEDVRARYGDVIAGGNYTPGPEW